MFECRFDVYGITVDLRTPLEEFHEFVCRNYAQFGTQDTEEPADIVVRYSKDYGDRARTGSTGLVSFGEGLSAGDDEVYWENEYGFRVRLVVNEDGPVTVDSFHHDLIGKSDSEERYKDYQRSMRWAIHFPLFAILRYKRGWHLTHAAAVAKDGEAVALCGLNGVGKSTLALSLCQEHGFELMTDNFLLVGPDRLYGFPEVLRLSPEAHERLDYPRLWDTTVYGKYHISAGEVDVTLEGVPKAFFFVGKGETLMTRSLTPTTAWEVMQRFHSYLGEFPEHSYTALWPYLTGEIADTTEATQTVTSTPWFEFTHEANWDLKGATEEIVKCI